MGARHIGGAKPGPDLVAEVERRYLADHERLWSEFMADLRLTVPATIAETAEVARMLSRPDSPLLALLRAIVREAGAADPAGGDGDGILAGLRQYVLGQPSPAEDAQTALGALAAHLVTVDDAVRRKALPPPSEAPRALAIAAQRAPEPVRGMLAGLSAISAAQVFAAVRDPLARQLAGELAEACARAVAGRYPLVRASRDEISHDEFARTFGAGGLLDAFFARNLAPYVDTSARAWTFRGATREQAGESLVQFQRANTIREAFFADGGRRLGLRLELRVLELDPAIGEFTLDVDGQQPLRFRRDVRTAQTLQWPGPGAGRLRLQASGPGGPGTSYVFEGPWALLRLLDRVRIEPGREPERFALVFDVEGRKARFEARGAPLNPALRQELERFQCPKRL